MDTPWGQQLADIEWIASGSAEKGKYETLLARASQVAPTKFRGVYLAPATANGKFWAALDTVCRAENREVEAARARWDFLSLEQFADTSIETPYHAEWNAIADWLKRTMADA